MYGIEGRSWVGMGDPIGQVEEYAELVWSFREMCDRYDGWSVFYEVGPETPYLYLDLGLTLLKLGEQGRVPLEDFFLTGSARKGLRYTSHKLEREGCIFEVVPTEKVPSLLPELKRISDAWLGRKVVREKGFLWDSLMRIIWNGSRWVLCGRMTKSLPSPISGPEPKRKKCLLI